MEAVYVVSAVRTGIGAFGGSLKDVPPTELGAIVSREAIARSGLEAAEIGHTVFGNVVHTEPRDCFLARVAAVNAGVPHESPALTVNRLCGSGLQAIVSAAQLVMLGDAGVVLAGGAETLSRTPFHVPDGRWGRKLGNGVFVDALNGALTDPFHNILMGVTAENVAARHGISREDQDALALESHRRAARATAEGRFTGQIVPVTVRKGRNTVEFVTDEHIRHDLDASELAGLRPAFAKENGTVTAGNASGINDGAAGLVLAGEAAVGRLGLKPMARLVAYAHAGVDPAFMGLGPIPAVRAVLARAGLTAADMDIIESNEAFAAQACAVSRELGLDPERVNPNGSGISLGHPVGATGAINTVKLVHELQRTGGRYGLVTMCIGGGQGIAAIFERV